MNYRYLSILSCFIIFGYAHAQNSDTALQAMVNVVFGQLNKTEIGTGILINKIIPDTYIESYDGYQTDSMLNYSVWISLYNELYNAHFNQPAIPAPDTVDKYADAGECEMNQYCINMGIINFKYNSIKSTAISDGLLSFDEVNDVLNDIYPRSSSPYDLKRCVAVTPLLDEVEMADNFSFSFINSHYYTNDQYPDSLKVDFDDGSGFRKIFMNENVSVNYSYGGIKTIKTKVYLGSQFFTSYSELNILSGSLLKSGIVPSVDSDAPAYDDIFDIDDTYNSQTIYGEYAIWYGCSHIELKKPIIVIEGYDPNNRNDLKIDDNLKPKEQKKHKLIWDITNTDQHLLDKLRADEYDIVILNFSQNNIDLRANAMLVVKLIQDINEILDNNESHSELIVMGRSGGGILARYALAYMEANNMPHRTKLMLTIDAGQQGFNVPLGEQHMIDYLVDNIDWIPFMGEKIQAIEDAALNCTYARQILNYHYTATNGTTANPDPKRSEFFNALNSLGYPAKPKKVAIADGSSTASGQGFSCGDILMYWHNLLSFRPDIRSIQIKVNALPDENQTGIITDCYYKRRFYLVFGYTKWFTKSEKKVTVTNVVPYDNAPGGTMPFHNLKQNQSDISELLFDLLNALPQIVVNDKDDCFAPTISSLDLDKSLLPTSKDGLYYNIQDNILNFTNIKRVSGQTNWYVNISPPNVTPFDAFYVDASNKEHCFVTEYSASWFKNETHPDDFLIQNKTINYDVHYEARNSVSMGKSVDPILPQGDVIITGNPNVTVRGGSLVKLMPGFSGRSGSIFKAYIEEYNCLPFTPLKSLRLLYSGEEAHETINKSTLPDIFNIIKESEKEITVYPNPTTGGLFININCSNDQPIRIDIFNSSGTMVLSEIKSEGKIFYVDLSGNSPGLYYVRINLNDKCIAEKIELQ